MIRRPPLALPPPSCRSRRPLHTVICNAGIMAVPDFQRSADGHELQFATNHLGHFLLVQLLLPVLLDTAKQAGTLGRVVVLSSAAHFYGYKEGVRWAAGWGGGLLGGLLAGMEGLGG